jgi:hypothetical protein
MKARLSKAWVVRVHLFVVLVLVFPLLAEPLAAASPQQAPPSCSGGTITLVSGDASVTIENPIIANKSDYGCDVRGAMRIVLAGNDKGNIAIQGRVDAYDGFTSTSIGYFDLQVAGLTLKAYRSSFKDGKLRLTWPAIKIPDSWGGLEATIPESFWVDSWGLTAYEFSMPTIKTQNGIQLDLRGALGLDANGYKIEAHGSLGLPDMGKTGECEITVDVILNVDAFGQTVMEIHTPKGTQVASLAGDRSEIALPADQAPLIPASMPLTSYYLPLPEEVRQQLKRQDAAARSPSAPSVLVATDDMTWRSVPAQGADGTGQAGPVAVGVGLDDASPGDLYVAGPPVLDASPAVAGPPQPTYQPAEVTPEWGSITITAAASCEHGIPIDGTGFELTGVDGTISLGGATEYVRLGVTFKNIKPRPFDKALLTAHGEVLFQWNPEFMFSLSAVLTVMEMLEVFEAEISVSESDGFRVTVFWDPLWGEVNIAIHAWSTEVRTCSIWDTWCIDPHPQPPVCGSECIAWETDDKFHFTGSASCEVGARQGEFWSGCIFPYPCHCRLCKAWIFYYPCCNWCWACVDIPPWDIWLLGAAVEFGEFTGDRWGLKGTVSILGFSTGFFVDHTGHLAFGDVSGYKLVTGEQLAQAREAWRAAQLSSGPDAPFPGDDTFSFPADDQVLVHFDLPLAEPYRTPIGITDLVSQVQVITQTDTIFSVKADLPLEVSLRSPEGVDITPDNYWQEPGGYVVAYTQTVSHDPVSGGAGADAARWRFLIASDHPALDHVDVRLDGTDVFTDVWADDDPMAYAGLAPGPHTVEVVPVGGSAPVLVAPLEASAGTDTTLVAVGDVVLEAVVLADDNSLPGQGGVGSVRVVNAVPGAEPLQVSMGGWDVPDLAYKEASAYQVMAAGAYSVSVLSPAVQPAPAITLTDGLGFGTKVASAGDVDGNGYADVLVGNATYNFDQGQVTLYLGSPDGVSPSAAWTATGTAGDKFGVSVAGAGDVNGDGYADVVIGAYGYNGSQGRAYVYYGSPGGLSATPAWTADGENTGDQFGAAVAGAGDVNGDGYADVVVGADAYDGDRGRAYLYLGSPTGLSASPTWTANGENWNDLFGSAVAGAGDVNNDGYADVVVGAYGYPYIEMHRGKAYLYQGSAASLPGAPSWTAEGENDWDEFGISVAGAGDVDGDGYADVVVGAYGHPGGTDQGQATLYYGSASGLPGWSTTGSLKTARRNHTATLLPDGRVLVAGGYNLDEGTPLLASAELYDTAAGGVWTPTTGSLNIAREEHTATLLPDGRVLVAGGRDVDLLDWKSAELFDPATGTFTTTGSLNIGRLDHTATLLPDGRVLVVGGDWGAPTVSAELYDPATGTFTTTGSLYTSRRDHTATLLPDGRVLVTGGYGGLGGGTKNSAELYDPATGTFTTTNPMNTAREEHTATLLPDGRVLVVGGLSGSSPLASAELYDPATGTLKTTNPMDVEHSAHTATRLSDGRVLVVGGWDGSTYLASAELYDPGGGLWTARGGNPGDRFGSSVAGAGDVDRDGYDDLLVGARGYPGGAEQGRAYLYHGSASGASAGWVTTDSLNTARNHHTATRLADGRVLVAGGGGPGYQLASAELYDPATGEWTPTGNLDTARIDHTATLLADGRVLVTGGQGSSGYLDTAELYDPATGTWTPAGTMSTNRALHTATRLADGRVLVTGGWGGSPQPPSAELYDPATGGWTLTGSPASTRNAHTATLLADGRVLVAGGWEGLGTAELYDPATGQWSSAGNLITERTYHTASLLADGQVLVAGGASGSAWLADAELYNPKTGQWTQTGGLNTARDLHAASRVPDGRVLVAGGYTGYGGVQLASAELYDPVTEQWTMAESLNAAGQNRTATRLLDGRVLVAGGYADGDPLASAEVYDLSAAVWNAAGDSDGDAFGMSVAGAGDVDGSGYADLVVGAPGNQGKARVYHGGVGLSPHTVSVEEGEVQTLFVGRMSGSPEPLVCLQTPDELYRPITDTHYVVDQAKTGPWSVNLVGDTDAAEYLVVSAASAHNPPILEDLTVDASDLANTLVSWRLTGDYLPVTLRLYANDGPVTQTLGITEPETVPLFQGIEVATIPISDDLAVRNATISTTVDLSILESGSYKLWVRVEDPVNPPVQGYVWGVGAHAADGVPADWNRVRIAAEGYDPLAQLAGAVEIPIDHSATWAESWTTLMTPTVTAQGLLIEFTPFAHPDVDGYVLEVSEAGQTHVITTGNTLYYRYDSSGQPVGDPVHYATFNGLTPKDTYTLRIAASDRDSGRRAWSQRQAFTVPLGDFGLGALEPEIALPAGQELVTATLLLTMTEDLFSDVTIYLDDYHLPPGISLLGLSYAPLGGGGPPTPVAGGGMPAPRRMPSSVRALAAGDTHSGEVRLQAHAALRVTADVPAGSYGLPFVGTSGELERQADVTLLVGAPQEVVVDPGATAPVVLQANLPLPSCAKAIVATIPPGAFDVQARVRFRQGSSNVADWGSLRFAGSHFTLEARATGSGAPLDPDPPVSVRLDYDPACRGGLYERGLHLRLWSSPGGWTTGGIACTPDPSRDRLTCSLSRLGQLALFEPALVYLPLVLRHP